MIFKDKIFERFFPRYDRTNDVNINSVGKGTLQRFNEIVGSDIDDYIQNEIYNLIDNVLVPEVCRPEYIPYLESMLGFDFELSTLRISEDMAMRRRLVSYFSRYYDIKGTKKCLRRLFGYLGMTIQINEYFLSGTFDTTDPDINFDDEVRTFDLGRCQSCSEYDIEISGDPSLTLPQIKAIQSIIAFNEPINVKLRQVEYNGEVLEIDNPDCFGDFDGNYNSDFC